MTKDGVRDFIAAEYTLSENYVHGLAAFGPRLKNFESPHSSRGSSPGLPAGNSVKRWLTVAERTGLIYLLPPFDGRIGRQLVKSPKIYLIDTGLLAHLLRIDSPQTMAEHPLAEKFSETFVVTEILKSWVHNGRTPDFCFFKESRGMEIALLIRSGGKYFPVAVTTKQHPLPADSKWSLKLARLGVKTGPAAVISTAPGAYAVAPDVVVQNVWSI